jgi:hypothetical protein
MWMMDAQQIAVSGYHLVMEDRPDLSDSSDERNKPTGADAH